MLRFHGVDVDAYKILFLGYPGSGKSSLIQRHLTSAFPADILPSTSHELFLIEREIGGEPSVLNVWDFCGDRRMHVAAQSLYEGAKVGLLVFDCTSDESFKDLQFWRNEMIRCCPEVPLLVVSAKEDLHDKVRITHEDMKVQCDIWKLPFLAASAQNGQGVSELFDAICHLLSDNQLDEDELAATMASPAAATPLTDP